MAESPCGSCGKMNCLLHARCITCKEWNCIVTADDLSYTLWKCLGCTTTFMHDWASDVPILRDMFMATKGEIPPKLQGPDGVILRRWLDERIKAREEAGIILGEPTPPAGTLTTSSDVLAFKDLSPQEILSIRYNEPTCIVISVGQIKVTIKNDGTVEYGEGYSPNETAKVLWEAVGHLNPLLETVRKLKAKIEDLEKGHEAYLKREGERIILHHDDVLRIRRLEAENAALRAKIR